MYRRRIIVSIGALAVKGDGVAVPGMWPCRRSAITDPRCPAITVGAFYLSAQLTTKNFGR